MSASASANANPAASRVHAPLRIRLDRAITVRALAILAVVLFHSFSVPFGARSAAVETSIPGVTATLQGAWSILALAVPRIEHLVGIFFLISGYFAFRAYQRSRIAHTPRSRRRFVRFYLWRRFWRIVPAFWVALLFSYFVSFDHPLSWDGLRKLAVNASLFKTLYPGYFFSINHAHWYVAVQWQLDLLYPLFLFVVARRSATVAVALAWIASATFLFVVPSFTDAAFFRYFPLRWGAEWSLGVYLAHRHLQGSRVFARPFWCMTAATLGICAGRTSGFYFVEWLSVRILLGSLYECLLLSRTPRWRWERALASIGVCSYSLYLLHIPVQQLVARVFRALGANLDSVFVWCGYAAASGVAAFALARLNSEYVENPSAALGNRLWRRQSLFLRWWRSPRKERLHLIRWCRKSATPSRVPKRGRHDGLIRSGRAE